MAKYYAVVRFETEVFEAELNSEEAELRIHVI